MPELNLNMYFVDMFPAYASILNAQPENKNMTKQEFINRLNETYDTKNNFRNELFLQATQKSEFETIKRLDGDAIFNEA